MLQLWKNNPICYPLHFYINALKFSCVPMCQNYSLLSTPHLAVGYWCWLQHFTPLHLYSLTFVTNSYLYVDPKLLTVTPVSFQQDDGGEASGLSGEKVLEVEILPGKSEVFGRS